jgi:hypothetical protein
VWEQANEIKMMLETAMEKVCAWSETVKAETSETAGHEATMTRELRTIVEA